MIMANFEHVDCQEAIEVFKNAAKSADSLWVKRRMKVTSESLVTCMLKSLQSNISVRSILGSIETCDFSGTAFQKALGRCPVIALKHVYDRMISKHRSSIRSYEALVSDRKRVSVLYELTGPNTVVSSCTSTRPSERGVFVKDIGRNSKVGTRKRKTHSSKEKISVAMTVLE